MMLKQPAVPAYGAIFHGSIQAMPNGEWRGRCAIRTDVSAGTGETELQNRSWETEAQAREWIQAIGIARGFKSMTWDG